MRLKNFGFLILPALLFVMSSCLGGDDTEDYSEWMKQNLSYLEEKEAETESGKAKYEKIIPSWDKASYILLKWHNNRSETEKNLTPLFNSTCDVKYLLTNIKGDTIDSSYAIKQYGDSIFRCKPNEMVTGFAIALSNMHVGDSVTAILPYYTGYGAFGSRSVLPFSTLIFQIKLKSIYSFDSEQTE